MKRNDARAMVFNTLTGVGVSRDSYTRKTKIAAVLPVAQRGDFVRILSDKFNISAFEPSRLGILTVGQMVKVVAAHLPGGDTPKGWSAELPGEDTPNAAPSELPGEEKPKGPRNR